MSDTSPQTNALLRSYDSKIISMTEFVKTKILYLQGHEVNPLQLCSFLHVHTCPTVLSSMEAYVKLSFWNRQ